MSAVPRYEEPICALSAHGSVTVHEPSRRDLLVAIEIDMIDGVPEGSVAWCRLDGHRLDALIATLTDARRVLRENSERQEAGA